MDPTTNNFNLFYLDIKTVSSPKTVEIIFCVRRILFSKLSIFYRVDTSRECSEYAITFVNRCYEKSFGSVKSMENKLFSKQSKKSTKFTFSLKYRKQKSHNLPLSHPMCTANLYLWTRPYWKIIPSIVGHVEPQTLCSHEQNPTWHIIERCVILSVYDCRIVHIVNMAEVTFSNPKLIFIVNYHHHLVAKWPENSWIVFRKLWKLFQQCN